MAVPHLDYTCFLLKLCTTKNISIHHKDIHICFLFTIPCRQCFLFSLEIGEISFHLIDSLLSSLLQVTFYVRLIPFTQMVEVVQKKDKVNRHKTQYHIVQCALFRKAQRGED